MNQEKVTPSVEMVSDWMSDSMFKEDALVMNSTVILPFISQYCVCHPTIGMFMWKPYMVYINWQCF